MSWICTRISEGFRACCSCGQGRSASPPPPPGSSAAVRTTKVIQVQPKKEGTDAIVAALAERDLTGAAKEGQTQVRDASRPYLSVHRSTGEGAAVPLTRDEMVTAPPQGGLHRSQKMVGVPHVPSAEMLERMPAGMRASLKTILTGVEADAETSLAGGVPLILRQLRFRIQTIFSDCLKENDHFAERMLQGRGDLREFMSYGHQLHRAVTKLRTFIFRDEGMVESSLRELGDIDFSELSSSVGAEKKEALIHCLLQCVVSRVQALQEAQIRAIFENGSMSREAKLQALARVSLMAAAIKKWAEIEFVFGGNVAFHNIYHVMKMSLNTAECTEGVELESFGPRFASLQFCNFIAAVFHDGKMVYLREEDGPGSRYKRKAGVDRDCSEGASIADLMRYLSIEHQALKTKYADQMSTLLSEAELADPLFLFHPKQVEGMRLAIEATVPRALDFFGPRDARLHTVANGGELFSPDYSISPFIDPAMVDRDSATHAFKSGLEAGVASRLAFYRRHFLETPGAFERSLEKLPYLSVPLSDLSAPVAHEERVDLSAMPFHETSSEDVKPAAVDESAVTASSFHSLSSPAREHPLPPPTPGGLLTLNIIASWGLGETVGLWAEEHPEEAFQILQEDKRRSMTRRGDVMTAAGVGRSSERTGRELIDAVLAKNSLPEAETHLGNFLFFMRSQHNFGLGRITAMEERVYFPLLIMERMLIEMERSGVRNEALLSDAWPIERIRSYRAGISHLRERFERLYCDHEEPIRVGEIAVKGMNRDTLRALDEQIARLEGTPVDEIFREFSAILYLRNGRHHEVAIRDTFDTYSRRAATLSPSMLTGGGEG